MTDTASLLRLMSWLSPVFPTGGFAYSAGLEQAVADGLVSDEDALKDWIALQLTHGSLWNDSVFFAQAHRCTGDAKALEDFSAHAKAMTSAHERLDEATAQGISFLEAASHWIAPEKLPAKGAPLGICIGTAAGQEGIDCEQALSAYLHSFVSNQLQVAIRLTVTGQSGAAALLSGLEPVIAEVSARAAKSTIDDLGTSAFLADIAAMNHETLQPRLFKS